MKASLWAVAAVVLSTSAVQAAPAQKKTGNTPAKTKPAKKKLTAVRVCPISLTPVDGEGAGNATWKNYKVYFC
jgi:hypothetical protein